MSIAGATTPPSPNRVARRSSPRHFKPFEVPMNSPTTTDPKQTGSHYTPPGLADLLARRLLDHLEQPADDPAPLRVLDPACGEGVLLEALGDRLPDRRAESTRLVGVDTDETAVDRARDRLAGTTGPSRQLTVGDFLRLDDEASPRILDQLGDDAPLVPDLVVANPPYVRTQVLGADRSSRLAEVFGLKGRLDLYQAFLVAMTTALPEEGLLGVITTNKLLTTSSAATVREFLLDHLEILELIDLGDTRLFDAAVLPSVLIGRKTATPDRQTAGRLLSGDFVRAYEAADASVGDDTSVRILDSRHQLPEVDHSGHYRVGDTDFSVVAGSLRIPPRADDPWSILSTDETRWLRRVDERADRRLGEICDVRVGIKTNADDVFVRDDWSELTEDRRPEDRLLFPLLTQPAAARWRPATAPEDRPRVLYPHRDDDGGCRPVELSDYPRARAYLQDHRDRLCERTYLLKAGRRWYEHWVPHRPARWSEPKIVFPDIDTELTAFYDDNSIVKGSCYWLSPGDDRLLYRLLGLLNSGVIDRYHDLAFQNRLYAGRRRYLTQYVKKYPVPPLESDELDRVGRLARRLVHEQPGEHQRARLEDEIEQLVREAFGL